MSKRSLILAILSSTALLQAGQIVTLHTGQVIRVDKADIDGDQIFISTPAGLSILSQSEVKSIVEEPDPNKPVRPVSKPANQNTRAMIHAAARANGLPPKIVESIAAVESGLKTDAVSPKGAIGVMQLMPGTAKQLGVDPNDVEQNINGGARLLRDLLIRYEKDPDQLRKALAAYNAGPGAVARHRGIPPYRETQNYVRKVLRKYDEPDTSPAPEQ
jgi:soluble lytic murein transglycosylase-like protein